MSALERRGVLLVQDGNHGANRPQGDEIVENGIPHVRAADIGSSGAIDFEGAQQVSESAYSRIKKGRAEPGDVLLTHKGTVGRIGKVPLGARPFLCSPQTTFWRSLDAGVLNQGFLHACLRSPGFSGQLRARMNETDMAPYVSLTAQRELVLPLPPIEVQTAVAEVLGTLDDKIESNRRLATVLEETAAGLFRARFVDFVGVTDLVESEMGPIPRGWSVAALSSLVENVRTRSVATSVPYIGLDDMPRGSTVLSEWKTDGAPGGSSNAFSPGDVLFGKLRPYFHKVGVAPIAGRCSTEVLVLRPLTPAWFGLALGHISSLPFIAYCVAVSSGTRMPRAEWKVAGGYRIAVPPEAEAEEFSNLSRSVYDHIVGLTHESRILAELRDALLPRLVSGQIRVREAEEMVKAV